MNDLPIDNATKTSAPSVQGEIGPLFLANFVHQVVNPLNGVIGTLDNITDGTYEGDVVVQKVNACRAQVEQCVTLIRNLAYFSDFFFDVSGKHALRKPKEGGISVLPQVVIEAAQFFQIPAATIGMRIELEDSRTQYKVFVRPELLKQLFINLFDNWLKYGLHNQTVKIYGKKNRKGELIVEVVGKSIGFSNVDSERLFDLAYRSPEAETKVAQGSGIGLYICRQIANHAFDGRISAQHNTRNGDTTFRIVIPPRRWR